jgi:rhodanese-related sulfurtransferase
MLNLIDRNALLARIAANPELVLVEALPERYYADWHLPGARHLPHTEVETLAPAVLPGKSAEIVTYCASASCQNSHVAARLLIRLGYTNVAVYAGGKQDWSDAGLRVERGTSDIAT